MQYKTSFFLTCLGQFFTSFNVFLGIYFMFQRFHTVKGYTYQEVLLCYSIVLMAFTLAEAFARGFRYLPFDHRERQPLTGLWSAPAA